MARIIWYVVQTAIVFGAFVYWAEATDRSIQPGAALIVGVGVAFAVTLFGTMLFDGCRRLVVRLGRVIHKERGNPFLLSTRTGSSKPLDKVLRLRVGKDPR